MKKIEFEYDKITTEEERCLETQKFLEKNPDQIPILIASKDLDQQNKFKYSCLKTQNLSHFSLGIKKKFNLTPVDALFLYIENHAPSMSEKMENLYLKYKSNDGYLRLNICKENTFG